jgi:hypothetical protein
MAIMLWRVIVVIPNWSLQLYADGLGSVLTCLKNCMLAQNAKRIGCMMEVLVARSAEIARLRGICNYLPKHPNDAIEQNSQRNYME